MSCCGNKRRAAAGGDRVASDAGRAGPSSPQDRRREPAVGRPEQPRQSAALLAYLARNGRLRRWT